MESKMKTLDMKKGSFQNQTHHHHVTLSVSEGSLRSSWRFFAAKSKSAAQNDMERRMQ